MGLRILLFLFVLVAINAQAGGFNDDLPDGFAHALSIGEPPKYKKNFTHFSYANPNAPKSGSMKSYALGTFDSLQNFGALGNPAAELDLIYDTLMAQSLDEPFGMYGLVARGVKVAQDGKSVEFLLDPLARFNDGAKITAHDVKFSFETITQNIQYRRYYEGVERVEVVNEQRVKFYFKDATNKELPLILGQLCVLPRHLEAESRGAESVNMESKNADSNKTDSKNEESKNKDPKNPLAIPIGSGPYEVASVNPGKSITYRRAKNYWAKEHPARAGHFNFDTIVIEYYKDPAVAQRAFMAREYDWRVESSAKVWASGYKSSDARLKRHAFAHALPAAFQAFYFNTRLEKFADVRVREAISLAFDFEWSNKNLFFGEYLRTTNIFTNSPFASAGVPTGRELEVLLKYKNKLDSRIFTDEFIHAKNGDPKCVRENLLKAQKLLASAGYTMKDGILHTPKNEPFSFEILLSSEIFERIALPFAKRLERLGIRASVRSVDDSQYLNRVRNFDYDMIVGIIGQSLNPGNEQLYYWGSQAASQSGSRNYAGVRDPVVDELIFGIINAPDFSEQRSYARALDRVLLWGFYAVPHFYLNSYRIAWWSDRIDMPSASPPYGFSQYLWWSADGK